MLQVIDIILIANISIINVLEKYESLSIFIKTRNFECPFNKQFFWSIFCGVVNGGPFFVIKYNKSLLKANVVIDSINWLFNDIL